MQRRSPSGHRRRWRNLRRNRRGVVSVVGTLLALLVFFALFGVFLTQYLPLWMSENESALTVAAQSSFAQLKSNLDLQVASGGPPVVATPFQMSSQSIPLLTQPTQATLTFVPFSSGLYAGVWMHPVPGGTAVNPGGSLGFNLSLGVMTMQIPDRYYSPQTFSYENDALVQAQSTPQQILGFPPPFSVNQTGPGGSVTVALVDLVGSASQATSSGPQEVFTHLAFTQVSQSTAPSAAVKVNATLREATLYPCAWEKFYNSTLTQSGLPSGNWTVSPAAPTNCPFSSASTPTVVTVTIHGLYQFTLVFAEARIVIGVGVE